MSETKILVIDDEKLVRWSLEQNLSRDGYSVITADKGLDGLSLYKDEMPDITLLDIHLPDVSGITVLEGIKEINNQALVVMITAFGDIQTAVKTIKLGAYDFVEKPFNLEKLKILVEKALETASLRREVNQFREGLTARYGFDSIIGESTEIKKTFNLISKVAKSDATTIFINGESGTGKDLVAKVIHYQSSRAGNPFMEINCTALPDTLVESELFGYEKGAFTDAKATKKGLFELADGGTVFLDEIGDMQPSTQAKLLKVIENKSFKRIGGVKDIVVDVRIIAATNKLMQEEVRRGHFREDLYYRLRVIPITLPPLRDRGDDVFLLSKFFIDSFNSEFKKNVKGLSKMTMKSFQEYPWHGNVRELKNVIERAMILESEDQILPEHLPLELSSKEVQIQNVKGIDIKIPAGGIDIESVEKELIRQALDSTRGNQTRAAKLLNLSRDTLRYRMQKFGFLQGKDV
ncbi:MAG: sigma-54-dependent Fis family transcriptional regulator [Thermodesulfovibrionales bacterium]|nr:sigma-54-dependent Fis family transcriptional regulator [Thermodesulfovibrionales bacterium]